MNLRKKKRLELNKNLNFKNLLLRSIFFGGCFLIVGFLFNLILSFFMYKTNDPTSLLQFGGIASLFLSTLVVSFIQSKTNQQYYLLGGIFLGIIIFVITVVVSLIISSGNISTNSLLLKSLIPAFSVIGSMLGIKKERSRKKLHR